MTKLTDSLIEKIENSTVVFGLQQNQIEIIEAELERFGNREIDAKYVKYIWEKLGKELAWEPFTLALYYFEYLEEKTKWIPIDSNKPEELLSVIVKDSCGDWDKAFYDNEKGFVILNDFSNVNTNSLTHYRFL